MSTPDPAWVALSLLKHVGSKTIRALSTHFNGDLAAVCAAEVNHLREVPGIGPKIAAAIRAINLPQTAAAIRRWQANGIHLLTLTDPEYPAYLAALDDAPPTLFLRGAWRFPASYRAVALVGTRTPSRDAVVMTHRLAAHYLRRGYLVVSGLALGIDGIAHQAALERNGVTLAVLGSGVLNVYPPEHHRLAGDVMQRGALLSEVHPEAAVGAAGLVARNRIITGLCERVIVVETEIDGGAMHAARFARAQGRQLYAVANGSSGNQALLAQGALPVDADL